MGRVVRVGYKSLGIVIPKTICEVYNIQKGDLVLCYPERDGVIRIEIRKQRRRMKK